MVKTAILSLAAGAVFGLATMASAGTVFGTNDGFESDTPGSTPANWFDGSNGWLGTMTTVASPTDGVNAKSGTHFAEVTPAGPNTYSGGGAAQEAPYGHIGTSVSNPSPAGWMISIDIFAQSGASAGSLWWTNAINNAADGSYLTESGFNIGTGASNWTFTTTLGGQPSVTVPTGAWYTMEVAFKPDGSTISATHTLLSSSGTQLYTDTFDTAFNPSVSNFGGPRYSWFTAWDNNGPDHIFVDNAQTAAVPLPKAAYAGLGLIAGLGLLGGWKRQQRKLA